MMSVSLNASERQHQMNNGSSFSYPASWKMAEGKEHIRLQGPEEDFIVDFLTLPVSDSKAELEFKTINAQFALPVSQKIPYPVNDFWEAVEQWVYDVPPSEGRVLMAFVRRYQDHTYINLI